MGRLSNRGTVETDYNFFDDYNEADYDNWLRGIVHGVIRSFARSRNARYDFEELMSEARLALVESMSKFNPEFNNSPLGWAKPYIIQRLHEFLSTNLFTFKVRYYNIRDDEEKLQRVYNMEAGLWSESRGGQPIVDGDETLTPLESHPSGQLDVDDQVALNEERKIMRDIVNELPKKERKVIVRRHRDGMSMKDIAKSMGISRQYVFLLYNKGIEKLRCRAAEHGVTNGDIDS